ncbi:MULTISPECIES: LCP family protein [unclassified Rhodococcus (in: high G+C Gram-positive bacteria)]|uniref:LCP family protein n=1 Tax=unclassified Rhodococcus (in: high G+C Gram-positive bacteria) TaxID=192944 RepID=UPI001B353D77|nr:MULTISPECIES: LCP family protein [unclassified Rhodococcus (in: high G+C Gram-positive bacteria)]
MRRDGRPQQQAWSQAPEPGSVARPPNSTQHHPRQPDWAPRQTPQPYSEQGYGGEPPRRRTPPPPQRSPRRPEPAKPPRVRRKRHWGRRFGLVFLVLALLVGGLVYFVDSSLTRVDALSSYDGRVADTPGTNWLLVGSDSRAGMTPEQEAALATGGEVGPSRTDTIILIHIPEGSGATTMVSLPRDSYVSVPGNGQDKLNASFALGGPPLLVQTVEGATGVRIDHYAEIGFGGFAGIVDALGGVDVCLQSAIDDPLAGISLPAGCQELAGSDALGFVRSRATALADLDRMNNQRQFMSALLAKATSPATYLNPLRIWPLMKDTASSLSVDEGDHFWNLASLAWAMRGDLVTTTVPVAGFEDSDVGNVLLWDNDRASQFFDALAQDRQIPQDLLTSGP